MRRVRVENLTVGELRLEAEEAHHLRDVLRLARGEAVEVFDAEGRTAQGELCAVDGRGVTVLVRDVREPDRRGLLWTVASAVPKGGRVDWMIEKLSELGADRFVPLATQRSVVHPEGKGKRERWARIAAEAAKQSRRVGVMGIGELVELKAFLAQMSGAGWYLSTGARGVSVEEAAGRLGGMATEQLNLLIGPEGGWTEQEERELSEAGLTGVSLGRTILRVETAAVAAAAVVAAVVVPRVARAARQSSLTPGTDA